MKKFLLYCVSSISAISAFSQITLTIADMPTVNTTVVMVSDTAPTILPGGTGVQTWDFSTLNNHGVDTTKFIDAVGTLYESSFPTANLATFNASSDSDLTYINSSVSALTVLGFATPTNPFTSDPFIVKFEPSGEDIIQLPATYNQSFSGSYIFKVELAYSVYGADSVRFIQHADYNSELDAWGSITTPFGFYNALRQKFTQYTKDSIWVHLPFVGWTSISATEDSSLSYRWFSNDIGSPMVEMFMGNDFATPVSVTYVKFTSLSVTEPSHLSTLAYPNPANNFVALQISNGNISSLEIVNTPGEIVTTQKVSAGTITISTSELPNGIYSIILRNKNYCVESASRIIVEH